MKCGGSSLCKCCKMATKRKLKMDTSLFASTKAYDVIRANRHEILRKECLRNEQSRGRTVKIPIEEKKLAGIVD